MVAGPGAPGVRMPVGGALMSTPPYPTPSPMYVQPNYPTKDRSTVTILEVIPGLFGILGIGWLYAGNTGAGLAWLIGTIVWDVIAVILATLSVGLGCFCVLPVNVVLLLVSVMSLNNYTKARPDLFRP
jgi:TM2 domain-containing membrane protein YozV